MDNATTADTTPVARIRTAAGTVHIVTTPGRWDTARQLLCGTPVPAAYRRADDEDVTCKRCGRSSTPAPAADNAPTPAPAVTVTPAAAPLPADHPANRGAVRVLADDVVTITRPAKSPEAWRAEFTHRNSYGTTRTAVVWTLATTEHTAKRGARAQLSDLYGITGAHLVSLRPDPSMTASLLAELAPAAEGAPTPAVTVEPAAAPAGPPAWDAAETVRRAGVHVIDATHPAPGAVLVTVQPGNARHAAAALIRAGWDTTVRDGSRVLAVAPEPDELTTYRATAGGCYELAAPEPGSWQEAAAAGRAADAAHLATDTAQATAERDAVDLARVVADYARTAAQMTDDGLTRAAAHHRAEAARTAADVAAVEVALLAVIEAEQQRRAADVAGQRRALRAAGYTGPWVEDDGRRTW